LEGSKLEKSNLATIIQLDKDNLKCLCFSDESKQKEFSIFIKFNEEGSISKVNCDCLYKEGEFNLKIKKIVMWCPHTVSSLLSVINSPEKIILYEVLQKKVKEDLSKEQLQTLVLNRMIEDVKLLRYIHDNTSTIANLKEKALQVDSIMMQEEEPILDVESYRKKLTESLQPLMKRKEFNIFGRDYYHSDEDFDSDSDDYGMGRSRGYETVDEVVKVLDECLNRVDHMYHQKHYGNALSVLKEITDILIDKFSAVQKQLTTRISEMWLLFMTNEEINKETRLKFLEDVKRYEKVSFPSDIIYRFIAAKEFVETDWESLVLQSILSGDYLVEDVSKPFKEHTMTLITRSQLLKSKMKERECIHFIIEI
jgi:hypothetical protein